MVKNAIGKWGSVRVFNLECFSLYLGLLIYFGKNPNKVCDDNWAGQNAEHNANSACIMLGFIGGHFETINQPNWTLNEISFFMDDVACASTEENFLLCPRSSEHDCGHTENVFLTCDIVQSISDRPKYCLSFTTQSDIADNVFSPSSATNTNIALCPFDESSNQVCQINTSGKN